MLSFYGLVRVYSELEFLVIDSIFTAIFIDIFISYVLIVFFMQRDTDWDYCIPDCGECCISGVPTEYGKAKKFVEKLDVDPTEIFMDFEGWSEGSEKVYLDGEDFYCTFLNQQHQCDVHDLPRPEICENFYCDESGKKIKRLVENGHRIDMDLKELYRERKNNGYDREEWLKFAADLVDRVYKMKCDSSDEFKLNDRVFIKL